MSSDLLSLNDILKEKKSTVAMRNRGQIPSSNESRANGITSTRVKKSEHIEDARIKIIQKKRKNITDARDKLAQIAKQSDARLKLQKLRAKNYKKIGPTGISHKAGYNGRISLSTNKLLPFHAAHSLHPSFIPSVRSIGYRPPPMPESHYVNEMIMNYSNDYLLDQVAVRRTVSNDYVPSLPPPPPLFNIKPYEWDKTGSTLSKNETMRTSDQTRPRDYKIIPRSGMGKLQSTYKGNWTKTRDLGIKSRLDSPPPKPNRIVSSTSRPKSNPQSTGYRIVVSNLQSNVTQEDIKELFEDIGELLVSRLVRPGIAEVIYKTLKDATKAVETYHNRQLDGHPMKCLLVNPRPKASSISSSRIISQSRTSNTYSQPSLSTVHRALFDN